MRTAVRTTIALGLAAGSLPGGALAAPATAADPRAQAPRTAWEPCGDGFECGQLEVPLDQRFDVVGFDPRGVVRSSPVRCFACVEISEQRR